MEIKIWRMGNEYKVYSDNTGFIRQLANANGCRVGASYFEKYRLVGLDAIMPFKAKFGRRIFRLAKKKGCAVPSKWPNLAPDEVLELKGVQVPLDGEGGLESKISTND